MPPRARAHEAVGLFHDFPALEEAVGELEVRHFPRESISVVGGKEEMREAFGVPVVAPAEAQADPGTPRRPPLHPEERNIGTGALIGVSGYVAAGAALLAGAAAPVILACLLAGAAAGGIAARVLSLRFRRYVDAQLDKGGLLLWVRTPDRAHEKEACRIMKKYGATHVRVQDAAV